MVEKYRETRCFTLFGEHGDTRMTVPDALAWLAGLHEQIPEECREDSTFLVEYESDYYGGGSLNFEVYYERKETDEEMAERIRKEEEGAARYRADKEILERQHLAALKAKYG